jgi:hypothetical protein
MKLLKDYIKNMKKGEYLLATTFGNWINLIDEELINMINFLGGPS